LDGGGSFASIGTQADFDFGSTTDFTVEMWVRAAGWLGDAPLISNKDWASGANTGWIIAFDPNGTHWQWNFTGASGTRQDFDAVASIGDGAWHHIAIAHDRDADARFFQDGVFVGSRSIAGQGNVNTGFPLAIGQDGTLTYGFNLDASIDGTQVWRRVLGDSEISESYQAGAQTYLGTNYCFASPNTTGVGAELLATGSTQVASADFQLNAVQLPANLPGVFFVGSTQINTPFGDGVRCAGGAVSRFNPPVSSSSAGVATRVVDMSAPPASSLFTPGSTWNFQYWYRDPGGLLSTFNLTDGLSVTWLD
jgi:hypothetical protein